MRDRSSSWWRIVNLALLGASVAWVSWTPADEGGGVPLPRVPRFVAGGRVELVAGTADIGDGGKAIRASVVGVSGLAVDAAGDLYFSDSGHGRVRKIRQQSGTVHTIAGNGMLISEESSALATDKALRGPGPLSLDDGGRFLFVGERLGRRVQKIDLASGTLAELPIPADGGFGSVDALVWTPTGLVAADTQRGQLWKLVRSQWVGILEPKHQAPGQFQSLARDGHGRLFWSDSKGNRVLKLDTNTGEVTVLAGGAGALTAKATGKTAGDLGSPHGLAFDRDGTLLVADSDRRRILKLEEASGRISVVRQSLSRQGELMAWKPGPIAMGADGTLWLGDLERDRILRFVSGATQPDIVLGGGDFGDGGPAASARLAEPGSVVADRWGNVYIADTLHHRVRVVEAKSQRIRTVVGTGVPDYNGDGQPGAATALSHPTQLQVSEEGGLYISDHGNHRIRFFDPTVDRVSTIAGNGTIGEGGDGGPATAASLLGPHAIYLDGPDTLVVASDASSTLRRIDLRSGRIWRIPLSHPTIPTSRAIQSVSRWNGLLVLVMPQPGPGSIDLLSRTGKVTPLLSAPAVDTPYQVAVSPEEQLFICDTGRDQVLRWAGETMRVVAEGLGGPRAISFDFRGRLLIADTLFNRVLRIHLEEPQGALAARFFRGLVART